MTKRGKKSKKTKADTETEEDDRNPNSDVAFSSPDVASPAGEKEGQFLLGAPAFVEIGNGRLRCAESGHELLAKDKGSYASSRACRLALIDAAVALRKPPLSAFEPHPTSKSKLVCKITSDVINKTEEHIWKHINGKRFQNKLEQMELEKLAPEESAEKVIKESKISSKSTKAQQKRTKKKEVDENVSLAKETDSNITASEEVDFWIPPVGSRWDFDDGRDRWECPTNMDDETDEGALLDGVDEKVEHESADLPKRRKKHMSADGGCGNSSSRKKKIKKKSASVPSDNPV
ncbi:uncharacterized protein [Typha angustifolia]|uniref:uncharacterized protein n=1 Tax=Typha angustifolia TaxID=59011 RepID=UPI003C2CF576